MTERLTDGHVNELIQQAEQWSTARPLADWGSLQAYGLLQALLDLRDARAALHASERELARRNEFAAGHPGMCCGQCIAKIDAAEHKLAESERTVAALVARVEAATDEIGIHPAAIVDAQGVETKRTERQTGWNEGVMELSQAVIGALADSGPAAAEWERRLLKHELEHATLVLAAVYDCGMGHRTAEEALAECAALAQTMVKHAQLAGPPAPELTEEVMPHDAGIANADPRHDAVAGAAHPPNADESWTQDCARHEAVQRSLRAVRDSYNGRSQRGIVEACMKAAAEAFAAGPPAPSTSQETTE